MAIFHWVVQPCLLLLSAFSFDHTDPAYVQGKGGRDESYWDMIPTDKASLINWVVHVVSTSFFFLGSAACAGIYGKRILPHLKDKGLIHPNDLAWTMFSASGLVYCCAGAVVVRILHIFHKPYFWIWPLAVLEVALILFC